jgi:hypothetical protein
MAVLLASLLVLCRTLCGDLPQLSNRLPIRTPST